MHDIPTQKVVLTEINKSGIPDKSVSVYGVHEDIRITWAYVESWKPGNLTTELV
jgi:hypothetical protein